MDAVSDRMALPNIPLLHDYPDLETGKITLLEGGSLHLGNGHFTPAPDLETGEMDSVFIIRDHGVQIAKHEERGFFMGTEGHLPMSMEWSSTNGNGDVISPHKQRRVQWNDNNGKDLVYLVEFEVRYLSFSLLYCLTLFYYVNLS